MRGASVLLMVALALLGGATPAPAAAPVSLALDVTEWRFEPATLEADVGSTVRLRVANVGAVVHDVAIAGLDVRTGPLEPGAERVLTFVASEGGRHLMLCTEPGHADRGVTGTFRVLGLEPSGDSEMMRGVYRVLVPVFIVAFVLYAVHDFRRRQRNAP